MADLWEINTARRTVLESARPLAARSTPLDEALGLRLAAAVTADLDSPPYDKSMMDGYAVRAADVTTVPTTLPVSDRVMAGMIPRGALEPGTTAQIMTGAPLPPGADCVIMVERTTSSGETVTLHEAAAPGRNIMRRGTSIRAGSDVLTTDVVLTPAMIGLCAEVGCVTPVVIPRPQVAVLSTGDELVACDQLPGPGQIRNSNSTLLSALVRSAGATVTALGIARDEPSDLRSKISAGLQTDMLILSGGVSAGVLDLVPNTLLQLGVQPYFHKVRLKPGKPLWFGVLDHGERRTLVFGLPGNPVSSAVCFELFVRPALRALRGLPTSVEPSLTHARNAAEFTIKTDRPTFWPAVRTTDGVRALPWGGSADLAGFARRDCLLALPAESRTYAVGEELPVLVEE